MMLLSILNLSIRSRSHILASVLVTIAASARAHELTENRATLVQRDTSHVSMTLFISIPEALHQVLAPERSFQDFVLTYSAMPQAMFRTVLLKAERQLQGELLIAAKNDPSSKNGQQFTLDSWAWPEAARVQSALQERAMRALVAPSDHTQPAALEIHVEFHSAKPITSLRCSSRPLSNA